MLKITVDDVQVEVEDGTTVLDAAAKAGITIPTFCHDGRIAPAGACRICMVEIEGGPPRLYASCVTPAADNMVVKTNSERIAKARKTNMELLLAHHPLDCPVCPSSGNCGLQDMTYEFGLQTSRIRAPRKEEPTERSNPIIEQNYNRCVLCSKCIRVCDEVQGVGAIGFVKRGFNTYVGTPFGEALDCDFCGHCVTTCPVGSRNNRFMMQGRSWNVRRVDSLCSFCGTGCSISYSVRDRDNLVVNAKAVKDLGINGDLQCSKGWQGFRYVHSEDRLEKPLFRIGEKLAPISWESALDEISKKLKSIIEKHGAQAVAGIGSERMTNEENYLFQKFFRTVIGSNKVDNILNMKNRALGEGLPDTLGGNINIAPLDTLYHIPLIFLIGADATEESPVVGNMVRRAVTKLNAKLIVANGRKIRMSRDAFLSAVHAVGTETAVINGILHEIFTKQLISEETASSRIENLEELKISVSQYVPDYVEKVSGVGPSYISQAAEAVASSEGTVFLCGRDIIETSTNNLALEALKNLILLTGNGTRGGLMLFREFSNSQGVNDMGVTPNRLPGYQSAKDPQSRERFEKVWAKPLPESAEDYRDIIQQALDGKIKALYIMGEDPVMRYPDGQKIREALSRIDLIICQDIFITETSSYANVILPGISFAEKSGTFTNMEGRVQRLVHQVTSQGEALPDLKILSQIAEKMGQKLGPELPEAVMEEIAMVSPLYSDCSPTGGKGPGEIISYGRSEVKPRANILPFTPPDYSTGDFPFILVTGNLLHHLGPFSRKSQALNAISPASFIEINPKDKRELGIKSGDMLLVESPCGKLTLPAKISSRSPKRVVFIPNNFENAPVNTLLSGNSDVAKVRVSKMEG